MDDLIARLNGLCERHSHIPEGPYFVGVDDAEDCPTHTNSGLSLVDTGRQADWPIARLCESYTASAIADIPTMLAAIREAAAELSRLTAENAALRADAERYRWLRYRVCGARDNWGCREFRFPEVPTKGRNIMQGSAAEHLDAAIDSARAKESGDG